MSKLKELLQEMLEAGETPVVPLDMLHWACETSCCLCGDVAAAREKVENKNDLRYEYLNRQLDMKAEEVSWEIEDAAAEELGTAWASDAIYNGSQVGRLDAARTAGIFTDEELDHPHLTTDHHDRAIAHDFIRLVMAKLDTLETQQEQGQ